MRIGLIPDSIWEWLLIRSGRVPTPLADTHLALLQARAVITASRLGIFEILTEGPLDAVGVARKCDLDDSAAERLLRALCACGYVTLDARGYRNSAVSARWLTDGDTSLSGKMDFLGDEWDLIAGLDDHVRSGFAADLHERLSRDGWMRYRHAMEDLARLSAKELARKIPLPDDAQSLLDIGGSHGLYAAAVCERHSTIRATVLDLPEALAGREPPHPRVEFVEGNILTHDPGQKAWDGILIANVAHHLSLSDVRVLIRRAAQALRSGGVLTIVDWTRAEKPEALSALLDLYFSLTSRSGTWSLAELRSWLVDSGLEPLPSAGLRSSPGLSVVSGRKVVDD